MSKIEWTEQTWNPIVGCSIVSPGCANCYAMKMAARLDAMGVPHYAGLTKPSKAGAVWTGKVALAPERILREPLRRRKPTMYFVNSMGDLFHEDVPDEWVLKVLDVIRCASYDGGSGIGSIGGGYGEHTFQVLTKRSARMRDLMRRLFWDGERLFFGKDDSRPRVILKNLWLGVSAERQQEADARIPDLLQTPAAVRFVSAEPLVGPINFNNIHGRLPWMPSHHDHFDALHLHQPDGLHWIIVGGESGHGARPMHPDWARSIRDQCAVSSAAFFFKQWGEWGPERPHPVGDDAGSLRRMTTISSTERKQVGEISYLAGSGMDKPSTPLRRVGKVRAGRLLDGREHNDMPSRVKEVA